MVARTHDYQAVRELACHPSIFPHVTDDWFPDPAEWHPSESEQVKYLLASDDKGPFGFGIFIPKTWSCYDSHIGFLPRSYGAPAIQAFKEMLEWMWKNSTAARLVGEICEDNRRAIRFATSAGFEPYGVNKKSKLRGGVLRDQVCLGISKP